MYLGHPDPSVDLACINVSQITKKNDPPPFIRGFSRVLIADFDLHHISAGTEVSFICYPQNIFDEVHNLPLIRRSYMASIPNVDFNGLKQFVIDAQVWPGSSGSPVFALSSNGKYLLLGVVMASMIRNDKLEIMETTLEASVVQVLGLGIVIKSIRVHELLDAARNKSQEARNILE